MKIKKCKHKWALVMAKRNDTIISVPTAKICIDCGLLKVGTRTIRISNIQLDMGNKPIVNASAITLNSRLRIPVGVNMFS